MTVGEKIAKIRRDNNLTQEQFAEILQVSRQSVSKWELDSVYPNTEKLIMLSKLFNCSLDYLLKDEIENKDADPQTVSEREYALRIRAAVLTYLSFPPLFGWIVGIASMVFQIRTVRNRAQMIVTGIGIAFSLSLTVVMLAGMILNL